MYHRNSLQGSVAIDRSRHHLATAHLLAIGCSHLLAMARHLMDARAATATEGTRRRIRAHRTPPRDNPHLATVAAMARNIIPILHNPLGSATAMADLHHTHLLRLQGATAVFHRATVAADMAANLHLGMAH